MDGEAGSHSSGDTPRANPAVNDMCAGVFNIAQEIRSKKLRLGEELGRGDFGVVYRGGAGNRNEFNSMVVVVKEAVVAVGVDVER